jgi:hypothetical protein
LNKKGKQGFPASPGASFNATCFWLSLVGFPPQDIPTPFHQNFKIPVLFVPLV